MLVAKQIMTADPTTIAPDATLRDAAELLQTLEVRHLPVVDASGELIGMLSDRDLRAFELPRMLGKEPAAEYRAAMEAKVSTAMTADVVVVQAEADVAEVVDQMIDNRIGAVPVVDAEGTLAGIISYVDVLRHLALD